MVIKRPLGEGYPQPKRRITSSNFAENDDLAFKLEPLIRKWVQEEVQRSFQNFFCTMPTSPMNAIEPSKKTSLQLRFLTDLPNTFFTGSRIESVDNMAVKLVLFDVDSSKIVSCGPYSSLKVEIVPLDGDFCADEDRDWEENEFDSKVIYAREGRRPLLTGNLVVTLQNGVADLGDLCFTDNSSWRRSRKFMIGARVKSPAGIGDRIREAKSQAFIVKDHRGESYKKHHPPSLDDDIWRLEKIAKDGVFHKRLASHRICTVKDFLQMYVAKQSVLRKLLGGSSNKTWERIIKHAKECVLDDKVYMYICGGDGTGVLLNSVLTVVGATFDAGQNCLSLDKLSAMQMPVVEASKQQVYNNLNGMVPMEDPSAFGIPVPISKLLHHEPLKTEPLGLQTIDIPLMQEVDFEMPLYGVDDGTSSEMEEANREYFSPALRNSFIFKEFGDGQDLSSGISVWQGNDLLIDPCNQTIDIVSSDFGICFSRNGSPRARWCKIRAALKWGSVRRDVASKRMAHLHSYLDSYFLDF